MNIKALIGGIAVVAVLGVILTSFGNNELGYRTVEKNRFTGNNDVHYGQGYFLAIGSDLDMWPDYLSYDFSAADGSCDYVEKDGVMVQYQDGGKGNVCGMVRVQLPMVPEDMIDFQKTYRTEEGARSKLMNQYIPKVLNLTAGLVSSEEAYATQRAEYQRMVEDQLRNGIYQTRMVEREVQVDVDEKGKPVMQRKAVPEIVNDKKTGIPKIAQVSPFKNLGITEITVDLKHQDFEPKTLKQISDKREAEMATVTAQANAKKAYWQEQEVIAQGKKAVAEAEYKEKQVAAREIVQAEKEKEKAEIAAQQKVEVARQAVLEQEQLKLAKSEEAEGIKILSTEQAAARKRLLESDGLMERRIEAQEFIAKVNAMAISKQKWVPEIQFNGTGEGNSNNAAQLIDMLNAKTAQDLGVSMKLPKTQ